MRTRGGGLRAPKHAGGLAGRLIPVVGVLNLKIPDIVVQVDRALRGARIAIGEADPAEEAKPLIR